MDDYDRPMHVFARGTEQPEIEVACDLSLDEGAIIRATFEWTLGSTGVEYFANVTPFQAEMVADLLSGETLGRDGTHDQEEIDDVVRRMRRLVRLAERERAERDTSGNPGKEMQSMKTFVTYRFDVSELDEHQIAHFMGHVQAQAEREKGEDGYPDVPIASVETTHEFDNETVRDEIYALISPAHPFESLDTLEDDTIRVAVGGRAFLLHVGEVD